MATISRNGDSSPNRVYPDNISRPVSDHTTGTVGSTVPRQDPDALENKYSTITGYGQYDTITMSDGSVLDNPYVLSDEEWDYVYNYLNGKFYWSSSEKRAAETAYNKYQQYVQWWNDHQNTSWETEYNSEESQISREVSAMWSNGLNPDLLGLSGGTAAASENNNTISDPSTAESDAIPYISLGIQGLQTAISIASGISAISLQRTQRQLVDAQVSGQKLTNQGLDLANQGLSLSNSGQELSNVSSVFDLANKAYDFLPDDFFETAGEDYVADITPAQTSSLMDYIGIKDSSLRQQFSNLMQSPSGSALAKRWRERHEQESQRSSYYNVLNDPSRYTPDNQLTALKSAYEFRQHMLQIEYDALRSEFEKTVLENTDPELAGTAADVENQSRIMNNKVMMKAKELTDNYLSYIFALQSDGNPLAAGMGQVAANNVLNGSGGFIAPLIPYIDEQIDNFTGYMNGTKEMPAGLKKALGVSAGAGALYLGYRNFLNTFEMGLDVLSVLK